MKRKWLMVPFVTGMLAIGLTGASALAHSEDEEQEPRKDQVAGKVAEILGLDEETVLEALTLAKKEVNLERITHRLDHMVEEGRITQEQADAYIEWYKARPDIPSLHNHGHRMMFGMMGGEGQGEGNGPRFFQRFGFSGGGEDGEEDGIGRRFQGRGPGAQRFGGQGFPGLGHLPNGLEFPGLGESPPGLSNDVPQGSGTSY